ncbi:LPD1 domain-containing protein [Castellaniella sp.]|uniref:LPD1 domain-containing protein n=1 Tax=Castellaniella sp. TaxID=1955812 RepID=UPI002AFED1E9|nr:LPD1 domain-containing protein [Castellaniella sp.]
MPNSPLRGTSLTCLDIYDQDAFRAGWKDGAQEAGQASGASKQERWDKALALLGFSAKATSLYEKNAGGEEVRVLRFVSPRMQFTLKDIQALVPGAQIGDLRDDMDVEEIALRAVPAAAMPQAWEQLAREVLAREAVGVWTPKVNPLDVPWTEAQPLDQFFQAHQQGGQANRLITRRGLGGSSHLRHVLDEAGYRMNAMVPFYLDEPSALADGWRAGEIEQVDLPYALPLWATDKGKILALSDVRFVPELMDAEPMHYLGGYERGLVAQPLREARLVAEVFERQMRQWEAWAADPQSLELPDFLWGSITEAMSAHADLCAKYPTVITSGLSELSDGKEATRGGSFRAKPLVELDSGAMFWLSRVCQRYVGLDDAQTAALQAQLGTVLARGHDLMSEHLRARAEQELAEIAQVVRGERDSLAAAAVDPSDTGSPQFQQWFGASQVVADDGSALKVYHGTLASFEAFDRGFVGTNTGADNTPLGFFFVADRSLAMQFAKDTSGIERRDETPRVIEAYLSIKKPMRLNSEAFFGDESQAATLHEIFTGERLPPKEALAWINEEIGLGDWFEVRGVVGDALEILERDGFDGVISDFGAGHLEYIAFHPSQIRVVDHGLAAQLDASGPAPAQEQKVRHEDAGEKIGGARKDFAKRAMDADDLEVMNEAERELFVIKKNVWGPLNYAQMRADGVSAEAALAIKVVKDKLLAAPARTRGSTEDGVDALYIQAVSAVRDRLAGVKTLDEFCEAAQALYKLGASNELGELTNTIYGRPMQVQWGQKVSDIFFGARSARVPVEIYREIRRKINIWDREPTEDEKWRSMIKPRREKTQEQRDEERSRAEVDRELHRPHLDRVQRSGDDWRAGRDIVADDLIEHFGFRGVEFGNWLPQDERQQVLNMAFDSLCDLAQALKLPPKGLSLGGQLAVAFGSRGSGGKHAALAHYEGARTVINLTRMNGAGSLAHEWGHALDHHQGQGKGFMSEAPVSAAMKNLAGRLRNRFGRADEILEKATSEARRGQDYARSWFHGQPQEVRDKIFDVLGAEYERCEAALYDDARRAIEAMKDRPNYADQGFDYGGAVGLRRTSELAEEVYETLRGHCTSQSALKKKARDQIDLNLRFMTSQLGKAVTVRAAQDLGVPLPKTFLGRGNCQPSDFLLQAEKLDETRASAYWATTRELFARAFASYVSDRIEEAGGRSDYLVYGADEQRYAEHPVGNPNPTGEDRRALAEHFDALIADYRLECMKEVEQDATVEP